MKDYDPKNIEQKWQDKWEKSGIYQAKDPSTKLGASKPKYYALVEFPYPSGDGLHVGHVRSYTAMDVIARKRRMEGFNVLYPIGWDAFGLPTENYALKTGKDPRAVTKENSDTFRRQIKSLGISFDWLREINTTDPKYYKWTQWIFLKFLENGLAYKAKIPINWCVKCKIGLANEEVIDNRCERCGASVEQKEKEQWMLAITKYAERLEKGLDDVDYPERVKIQQKNWIGRSEGVEIEFSIYNSQFSIKVFTTRPDTIFGTTYMVCAPEHKIVQKLKRSISNWGEVSKYVGQSLKKSEEERMAQNKAKTGVELKGVKAINPANGEEIPIWIADYVLSGYGTGAIMAVPAHDERDFEFAKKYNLPIKQVIAPNIIDKRNPPVSGKKYVERKNVHAIVYNPKTKKYLALHWPEFNWTTFPMGGIEEGEDVIVAGMREVQEETGFTNLRFIRTLPWQTRAEYFAKHKNENRVSYTTAVIFELLGDEQSEISKKESDLHKVIWLEEKDLDYAHMTHAEVEIWKKQRESDYAYIDSGYLVNSLKFSGMESEKAKGKIIKFVGGKPVTKYKLRDWIFSRQRYWGEPIPVIHCGKCGVVPVPEKDLPVELPQVEKYQPREDGESPLANIDEWVNVICPKCGGEAKRETDVMPNWAGSSWYFLAYLFDIKGYENPVSIENWKLQIKNFKHFMPVDWYNGGMEHTVLHLLYSRFWNKFLYDLKLVPMDEPYQKRSSHGLVLAEGGEKMSKSKGNVINPDTIVERFGADTLRLYEMFMGPFEHAIAWSEDALVGPRRFLEKVWRLKTKVTKGLAEKGQTLSIDSQGLTLKSETLIHQTIKKVSEDIESMGFNTAVSSLMIYANFLEKREKILVEEYDILLKLLAPFAPHITEELRSFLGYKDSIHIQNWPTYDSKKLIKNEITLAIQINGRVRTSMLVSCNQPESEIKTNVLALSEVQKWLGGKSPKKIIVVPGRIISIVT